jgi:Ca2+-binding EF-hand superfamily protein
VNRFQILACAGIALGSAAAAQTAPKPISRGDYQKTVDSRFNALDTNHDGQVSKSEFEARRQLELQQANAKVANELREAFKRLDTNKDGKLTLEEFLASAPTVHATETIEQMIARLDTNHDGKVSADEFRGPEMVKFNRVDANHDGIVTPAEIQAARGK